MAAFIAAVWAGPALGQTSAEILKELERFRNTARVLYVAAHPDDENTHLLAYLSHGRAFDVAYMSMTRGEGGQNLIGDQLGEALGAIRTYELLEARRIDGARQFFSRSADFGYSKRFEETLDIWGHEDALADLIFAVRWFQPDVVITRFPPEPMDGMHGHHTASARLAVEAFEAAADPEAFPEQLTNVSTWQPTRVVFNDFRGMWDADADHPSIEMQTGGFDAVAGAFYGEIAARSRSMHKSQGFGAVAVRGPRTERFHHLAGEPARRTLFDGIDTTWARYEGGSEIGIMTDDVMAAFDAADPSGSVEALLSVAARLEAMPDEPAIRDKRRRLDALIAASAGIYTETLTDADEAVPSDEISLRHRMIIGGNHAATWKSVRYPSLGTDHPVEQELRENILYEVASVADIPADQQPDRPFWLRSEDGATFDPRLIVGPHEDSALPIQYVVEIGGREVLLLGKPEVVRRDPVQGEVRSAMAVVPPAYVSFMDGLQVMAPGESRSVEIEVTAVRDGFEGDVRLKAPDGWSVSPASHPVQIESGGGTVRAAFQLKAPSHVQRAEVSAEVVVDGRAYSARRDVLSFDHIDPIVLNPPARTIATSVDVRALADRVGYIAGAGDGVPTALEAMGVDVSMLATLPPEAREWDAFDAIVTGIRAFNTRPDLARDRSSLFDYVERGGVLIIQYNTTGDLLTDELSPLRLHLSRGRVTDEASPVERLAPDHPALNAPNRITGADFEGWVQERGLYFAGEWDERFEPILAMNDPGEAPLEGALLVAPYGEGHVVYAGLSFFRQLPAGVPGAFRLFANLISLGQ